MRIGYADMVADLFHRGHVEFLAKASSVCDYLIVGIHSDEDTASYKRRPIFSMEDRAFIVSSCRHVDEVIMNAPVVLTREWIQAYNISMVIHGDDGDPAFDKMYAVPREMGIMRIVPYYDGISTTKILEAIKAWG